MRWLLICAKCISDPTTTTVFSTHTRIVCNKVINPAIRGHETTDNNDILVVDYHHHSNDCFFICVRRTSSIYVVWKPIGRRTRMSIQYCMIINILHSGAGQFIGVADGFMKQCHSWAIACNIYKANSVQQTTIELWPSPSLILQCGWLSDGKWMHHKTTITSLFFSS